MGGRYIGAYDHRFEHRRLWVIMSAVYPADVFIRILLRYHVPCNKAWTKNGPDRCHQIGAKLPTHRFALGGPLNLRLSPQLVAGERDIDNLMSFLRAIEGRRRYQVQFNIVSSEVSAQSYERTGKIPRPDGPRSQL